MLFTLSSFYVFFFHNFPFCIAIYFIAFRSLFMYLKHKSCLDFKVLLFSGFLISGILLNFFIFFIKRTEKVIAKKKTNRRSFHFPNLNFNLCLQICFNNISRKLPKTKSFSNKFLAAFYKTVLHNSLKVCFIVLNLFLFHARSTTLR